MSGFDILRKKAILTEDNAACAERKQGNISYRERKDMAFFQCRICGGKMRLHDGITEGRCSYCGNPTVFPNHRDARLARLYAEAENFRKQKDFERAVAVYDAILELDDEDSFAYFGRLVSRYGVEYVEDPATHEWKPVCHREVAVPILSDPDYKSLGGDDYFVDAVFAIAQIQVFPGSGGRPWREAVAAGMNPCPGESDGKS